MTPPRAAPPEAWLQALILVQVLYLAIGTFFADDAMRGPRSPFVRLNTERLEAFAAAGRPDVVALGNSTLKTALPDWTELPPDHPGPRVLRLVDDHAFFDAFTALIDPIVAARPRAVLLQSAMLDSQPSWRTGLARFRVSQTAWLTGTDDAHHVQFGDVCPKADTRSVAEIGPRTRQAQIDEHVTWWRDMARRDPDAEAPRLARDAIRRFTDAGIRVILLDLPQTAWLTDLARPAEDALRAHVDALDAASPDVDALRVPPQPDPLYCDLRHFNPAGRDAVWGWLAPQLRDLLP